MCKYISGHIMNERYNLSNKISIRKGQLKYQKYTQRYTYMIEQYIYQPILKVEYINFFTIFLSILFFWRMEIYEWKTFFMDVYKVLKK